MIFKNKFIKLPDGDNLSLYATGENTFNLFVSNVQEDMEHSAGQIIYEMTTNFSKLKKIQTMPIFFCDHKTRNHNKRKIKDYKHMKIK